jgi:hypothetical protein
MSKNHEEHAVTAHVIADLNMYLPHLQSMMQDTLRTLANIDFEHEIEIQKLEQSNTDKNLKRQIAARLKERHRERREPYIQLLAELHMRATSTSMFPKSRKAG